MLSTASQHFPSANTGSRRTLLLLCTQNIIKIWLNKLHVDSFIIWVEWTDNNLFAKFFFPTLISNHVFFPILLLLLLSKQWTSSGSAYSNISLAWGPFQTATSTRPRIVLGWRRRVKLERCRPSQPTSPWREPHPRSPMIPPTTVTHQPSCPSLRTKCVQCKSITPGSAVIQHLTQRQTFLFPSCRDGRLHKGWGENAVLAFFPHWQRWQLKSNKTSSHTFKQWGLPYYNS